MAKKTEASDSKGKSTAAKKSTASSKSASKNTEKKPKGVSPKTAKEAKQADAEATGHRSLWTALIWIGILLVIAGLSWMSHQEPTADVEGARTASQQTISDFQEGDCSSVYESTTDAFKERATEENWNTQCSTASDILQGEPQPLETQDNDPGDDAVQFSYSIEGTDDQTYLLTTVMIQQNGDWRMDGLSSQIDTRQQNQ